MVGDFSFSLKFPRWDNSYVGLAVLAEKEMMNIRQNGYVPGNEILEFKMMIPPVQFVGNQIASLSFASGRCSGYEAPFETLYFST